MKYENAKDVLPEALLKQVQEYISGKLMYVPTGDDKRSWGEASGYREKLKKRNQMICERYRNGATVSELADAYFLSVDSVKKIVYSRRKEYSLMYESTLKSSLDYANAGMIEEWLQSHLRFTLKNEALLEDLNEEGYIYFGVVKAPLRLIRNGKGDRIEEETFAQEPADLSSGIYSSDEAIALEDAPIILECIDKKLQIREVESRVYKLKAQKLNSYPAIVLIKGKEEHRRFMTNYGRHFQFLSSGK